MSDYIHSAAYQSARAQKKREWKAARRKCHICGMPIDYSLTKDDPEHFQLDHIKSKKLFPELERDPLNWAPSHASCNKNKHKNTATQGVGGTSEEW